MNAGLEVAVSDRLENAVGEITARPEELREVRRLMTAVFGSTTEAEAWLHTAVPAFNGHTPISLIRRGKPERVVEVLATMEPRAFL
jgi:uncharacterized protein (DUF2384 family)